jgi:hypothetical protein
MRMVASPKCKPKTHRGGWKCYNFSSDNQF